MVRIKKGISMIVLLITIAVFLILVTVVTISSNKILNNTKKKQFAREIYEVQNLVDKYKYEKEEYPYTILDDNTNESISIDITDEIKNQFENEDITEDNKVVLYSIDLNKIGAENITRGIKKDNNLKDVYAFSNKTGIVYYIDGYKVGNNTYYTLTDELKKIIGYGKDNSNETDSKIISEIPSMDYVQDGLVLLLDGIHNIRGGHSTNTNVWEDLSGNNYDTGNISLGTETYWDENNMVFNNTNKMILISDSNKNTEILNTINSNQFTVQFFVNEYTKSNDNYSTILWSTNDDFAFYSYTSQSIFYLKNSNNSRTTIPISSVIGKTVTISFDLNNKTLKLYSDTDKSSEVTISETIKANNFNIGRNSIHNNFSIGEIRIYNRILTEKEINHNYMVDKARYGIK